MIATNVDGIAASRNERWLDFVAPQLNKTLFSLNMQYTSPRELAATQPVQLGM
jgi:hypothetical protein